MTGMMKCPNCDADVAADATFCDNCGSVLSSASARQADATGRVRCPNCGATVLPDESFCGYCGVDLRTMEPAEIGTVANALQGAEDQAISTVCPNCNSTVQPEDRFCDNCGHALLPASGYPQTPQRRADSTPRHSPADNPRLLIMPSGATLALLPGRDVYVIGREDPASGSFPDVDLVPFGGEEGGVSRRHARITRRDGSYFIEDLNSVNYTFVNKQKLAADEVRPIKDGDEIRLGRVLMQFKTN